MPVRTARDDLLASLKRNGHSKGAAHAVGNAGARPRRSKVIGRRVFFPGRAGHSPLFGGAAGAFHTATAASLLFLKSDVSREDAAAVSIAMHLVYFAPAIVFGLYYFIHGDISIDRFRSLMSSEHAVEEIESEAPDTDRQDGPENGQ